MQFLDAIVQGFNLRLSETEPFQTMATLSRFIDTHLSNDLTIGCLAEVAGCSRRQLTELYKQHYGLTIHEYVVRTRIKRAEELVRRGEKIEAAMLAVGYRNRTHFNRAFKKVLGRTPSDLSPKALRLQASVQGVNSSPS